MSIAAVVVFVTTYAMILPAITLEKTAVCGIEEHQHSGSCYEKILVCGKEVHTHSEKCYEEDGRTDAAADDNSSTRPSDPEGKGNSGNTESEVSDFNAAAEEVQPESYVPELDPLDMETMLDSHTDFYFFHAEEGQEVPADSAENTDWKKAEQETVLASTDLVKMYLAYTIPAGSLNETNAAARYRLPDKLHLSDQQIDAMNRYENGIAVGYMDYDAASDSDEMEEEKENYQR